MNEHRTDLEIWCRKNWDSIPEAKRRACLDRIRPKILASDLELFRAQHMRGERLGSDYTAFHYSYGMQVRNALRSVLKDDQLPVVEQPDGSFAQNWDDFYTGALEQLCEETSVRAAAPLKKKLGFWRWFWGDTM